VKLHRLRFGPLVWELIAWHLASDWHRDVTVRLMVAEFALVRGQNVVPRVNARRGTWTGCTCGSVVEYTKSSDCQYCKYGGVLENILAEEAEVGNVNE
jgi:hypothetical protein